jgi:hypothetical protein
MKLIELFPNDCKKYEGHRVLIFIFAFFAVVSTARSLLHIFLPDGGSSSIAGITLSGAASGAIIFVFAWAGIYQLLWAGTQWLVILKYRGFVPLLSLMLLLEQIALFLLPFFKPSLSGALAHTPPEAIANKILLPVLLILFAASLFRQKNKVQGTQ